MPILVVDDNEAQRYALSRMLDNAGFRVLRANSLTAASSLARSQHPSLILLDVHLPDGIGFDLFQELRDDPATSDIPVVFHSATLPGSSRFQAEFLGAEGFLTYPITQDQLFAVVRGVTVHRPPQMRD